MSRPAIAVRRGSARFPVARASLFCLFVAPAITACLDTPPEYRAAIPVPPVIETSLVTPSTTAPVVVTGSSVDFKVPFRSDDEGEPLIAFFVYDYPTGGNGSENRIIGVPVDADPRPFAEQTGRVVDYPWAWENDVKDGCHSVTMILSHRSNFDLLKGYVPTDALAAAQVSWFLGLGAQGPACAVTAPGAGQ